MSNIYIQEPPSHGKVLLLTSAGEIEIELWSKEAPLACRNFVQLCMEGYYKNTVFHRVIPDFIAQGGDPMGTGEGGESIYGKPFKDEFHSRLRFVRRGLVAMANCGRDDNGSQFFFTLGQCKELNNKHTIFGKVAGDTLYNLPRFEEGEIAKGDRPVYPHKITSCEVLFNPFDDIVPRAAISNDIEKSSRKKKSKKGIKNFSLLSFGEVAEEEEEIDISVTQALTSPSEKAKQRNRGLEDLSDHELEAHGSKRKKSKKSKDHDKSSSSKDHDKSSSSKDHDKILSSKDNDHDESSSSKDIGHDKSSSSKDKDHDKSSSSKDKDHCKSSISKDTNNDRSSSSNDKDHVRSSEEKDDDTSSKRTELYKSSKDIDDDKIAKENNHNNMSKDKDLDKSSKHKVHDKNSEDKDHNKSSKDKDLDTKDRNSKSSNDSKTSSDLAKDKENRDASTELESNDITTNHGSKKSDEDENKNSTPKRLEKREPKTSNSSKRSREDPHKKSSKSKHQKDHKGSDTEDPPQKKRRTSSTNEENNEPSMIVNEVEQDIQVTEKTVEVQGKNSTTKTSEKQTLAEKDAEKARHLAEMNAEIKQLKRELRGKKPKAKDTEDKKDEEKSPEHIQLSALEEYHKEKDKYIEQQRSLPKKGKTRQAVTLAMFDKFTNKVKSALANEADYDNDATDDDSDWMQQPILFESTDPVVAKDASSKDDSWYPLDDPRHPLNRARRGEKPSVGGPGSKHEKKSGKPDKHGRDKR